MNVFEPFTPTTNGPDIEAPPKRKRGRPRRPSPVGATPAKRGRPKVQATVVKEPQPVLNSPKARPAKRSSDDSLVLELAAQLSRRPAKSRTKIIAALNRIFA